MESNRFGESFLKKMYYVLLVINIILFSYIIFSILKLNFAHAAQPTSGPGGSDYIHESVVNEKYGTGAGAYYIFEPRKPKPLYAPVIVFLHGLTAINPSFYIGWINHLVKKGSIVIYPVYQASMISFGFSSFTKDSLTATKAAFDELIKNKTHVQPMTDWIITCGHSVGGILAVNFGVAALEYGLPPVRAIFSVEPAKIGLPPLLDLSTFDLETKLVVCIGDRDFIGGKAAAKKIYEEAILSPGNKNYVIFNSSPVLYGNFSLAGHMAPLSFQGAANDFDFYGYWKILDGLKDYCLEGIHLEYAMGDTIEQRYMGDILPELTVETE